MFKNTCQSLVVTVAFLGIAAGWLICGGYATSLSRHAWVPLETKAQTIIGTQGPTITALEGLEELATVRVCIADVLTASDGRYSGAWLIKGDALVAVDLRQAQFAETSIDPDQRRAELTLPLPRVIQARLDHERTKTWDVKRVTWVPYSGNPDRLRDTAMFEAQKLVEFAAAQAECIDQGKARAEALVAAIYSKLGWTVTVKWKSPISVPGVVNNAAATPE